MSNNSMKPEARKQQARNTDANKPDANKPDARAAEVIIPDKSNKTEITLKAFIRALPLPPQKKRDEGLAREITDWSKWVKENPQKASSLVKEWFDKEEG
ncbi:MAG: hypothetical protein HQK89_09140 [Nitrospirae bacterium]|nr:hypothetical protein [Nitrospirota bacterium]